MDPARIPSPPQPSVTVAVVMEREAEPNPYEAWRFRVIEVVPDEAVFGTETRVLRDDGKLRRTLYPGFTLELFRDQAEGYWLNLSSGAPVWFVVSAINLFDGLICTLGDGRRLIV